MVNTEDFIKRLEIILDYYSLNASAFADKIGVQRSSLSHLLSGRNKPSLDFILKILEEFPEVDLYWVLNGKGQFPRDAETNSEINKDIPAKPETSAPNDLFSSENPIPPPPSSKIKNDIGVKHTQHTSESAIEKIVVFYKNGTFKTYFPE
ncbi:helix-turn-helix domain-containing protein [Flavobacterium faecale]|uniref:helix-turn-helix domain-containing protein n=1 Tax=Flavobacterium faecale TaxID=1355330 RepID=UPI003AAC39C6